MRPLPAPSFETGLVSCRAFTLVELLVALVVTAILVAIMFGLLSSATMLTTQSRKQIDADSEARMIFDRISSDFAGMFKQPNVDYIFAKPTGNDALFFYSEAPALADATSTYANTWALVGYRVNSANQLERLGKGLTWGAAPPDGALLLTYPSLTPPLTPDVNSTFANPNWSTLLGTAASGYNNGASTTYYHVIGEAVFRLEFCFLLKPSKQPSGTILPAVYSNLTYNTASNPSLKTFYSGGSSVYSTGNTSTPTILYGLGLADVQAVVVTLAILDVNSRKIVSTANLQTLAGDLPDPTDTDLSASPPKLMAQTWNNVLATAAFTGVLKAAAANVHVYQRTFYLGPYLNLP